MHYMQVHVRPCDAVLRARVSAAGRLGRAGRLPRAAGRRRGAPLRRAEHHLQVGRIVDAVAAVRRLPM